MATVHIVSIWDKKVISELFKGVHLSTRIVGNFQPENNSLENIRIGTESTNDGLLPTLEDLEIATSMTCSVCNIAFKSRQEQVRHFKLDWHCENLKRRDEGLPPINKEGTGVSNSSHHDSTVQKQELSEDDESLSSSGSEEEDYSQNSRTSSIRRAKIYFENESNELLSVHRCILLYKKEMLHNEAEVIERLLLLPSSTSWAILLLGGGHFAGGIFKENDVLVHKTFHRYITRAKQGSVQSIHDQHRKHAKSAGAQLRRHNELALIEEIQTLCQMWSELLNGCSRIFYRATGNNKRALFGGKKPLFLKDDHRLRSIPFPTKQASHQEVVRTCNKLSTIECYGNASEWKDEITLPLATPASPKKAVSSKLRSSLSKERNEHTRDKNNTHSPRFNIAKNEGSLDRSRQINGSKKLRQETPRESRSSSRETNDENLILGVQEELFDTSDLRQFEVFMPEPKSASISASGSEKAPSPPFDKEGQRLRNALYTACKVDDNEAVQRLLAPLKQENNESKNFSRPQLLLQILNSSFGNNGVTLLHICAQCGYTTLLWFLLETGADPSIGDKKGQHAYVLAVNKETRNTFRRFMALFPEKYDYVTAQIPSPLSEEAEKAKLVKQQQKRQQKKQKAKVLKIEQDEKVKFLNSTDAEKKMNAKTQKAVSRCFFCGNSLENKVPFSYDEFKFCTLRCLQLHRRKQ